MDVKIKKGVSLFKQLPWVEQMEGIRKYIKPQVPNCMLSTMCNRRKEERFQRDREKLQGG